MSKVNAVSYDTKLDDALPVLENRQGAHAGVDGHDHLYGYWLYANLWTCECGRKIRDEDVPH